MAAKKNPPPAAAELPPFAGFPKQGVSFFRGLAVAQSRDWFQAHRADYERLWKQPMLSLLHELHAPLAEIYRRELSPVKVFRQNRDVRFSNDKSPYKTSCSGVIGFEGKAPMGGAAIYVQLGLEDEAACGFYDLEPDRLARLRKQVLAEKSGAKLASLLAVTAAHGQQVMSMGALKRAPAGVAKDHPRVEILKHKGLALSFGEIPRAARYSAALKEWLLEQARIAAPVVRWAAENKIG